MLVLLKLALAHVVAELVPWPGTTGQRPRSRLARLIPAFAMVLCSAVLLGAFLDLQGLVVLACLGVARGITDLLVWSKGAKRSLLGVTRQFVHLSLIVGAAFLLMPLEATALRNVFGGVVDSPRVLTAALIYLTVVVGGGRVVQYVTARFLARVDGAADRPGLPEAGKYIGWLERFLILTFLVSGHGDAIGFLLAAKALARYPEIRDSKAHFAEYFLVGTLTSVGFALVGGILLEAALEHL